MVFSFSFQITRGAELPALLRWGHTWGVHNPRGGIWGVSAPGAHPGRDGRGHITAMGHDAFLEHPRVLGDSSLCSDAV